MPVSPLDFELYSRVTGNPLPMSAAERMKMAPEVYQFTKDYGRKSMGQRLGNLAGNVLKVGALGAAAYAGARAFGIPSTEYGQNVTETQTSSNLINQAADKASQLVETDTVSESLAENQVPEKSIENLGAEASEEMFGSPLGKGQLKNYVSNLLEPSPEIQRAAGVVQEFAPQTSQITKNPLTDNPDVDDVPGGETSTAPSLDFAEEIEDININGTNTSATRKLTPRVIAIASSLDKGLATRRPEERIIIAQEIDKKREKNPLEERAEENQEAIDSGFMRLSDEERKKESIRLGSTGGIPNKTDMQEIRKDPEYIAAQESMLPKTTAEKADDFRAKFVEGAYSDIVRGQRGNQSLGITRIPATNGDAQTGFVLANKPLDQSPDTAKTYGFGVAPGAEDMLKNQLQDSTFDLYMDRGLSEAKPGKKRKAGEIFEFLSPRKRIVQGEADLGDIVM